MSYFRNIKREELIEWLEFIDYEQFNTEELADKLIERWDVLGSFNNL